LWELQTVSRIQRIQSLTFECHGNFHSKGNDMDAYETSLQMLMNADHLTLVCIVALSVIAFAFYCVKVIVQLEGRTKK
jgi:hypothetical protein